MDWFFIAACTYFMGASAFFTITYIEGLQSTPEWDSGRVLGLVLAFVWPVTILWTWSLKKRRAFTQASTRRQELVRPPFDG